MSPVHCVQSQINVPFKPSVLVLGWLFTTVSKLGAGVFVLSENNFVSVVKSYTEKRKENP